MSKMIEDLRRGDVVRAIQVIDHGGAAIQIGDIGVVCEKAPNSTSTGPMVKWMDGTVTTIADGDVENASKEDVP